MEVYTRGYCASVNKEVWAVTHHDKFHASIYFKRRRSGILFCFLFFHYAFFPLRFVVYNNCIIDKKNDKIIKIMNLPFKNWNQEVYGETCPCPCYVISVNESLFYPVNLYSWSYTEKDRTKLHPLFYKNQPNISECDVYQELWKIIHCFRRFFLEWLPSYYTQFDNL